MLTEDRRTDQDSGRVPKMPNPARARLQAIPVQEAGVAGGVGPSGAPPVVAVVQLRVEICPHKHTEEAEVQPAAPL